MKMKSLFSLLFLLMLLVNISVIFVVNRALDSFQDEEHSLMQLAEITLLGSELQQSSDNLTKFARAYGVTGDPKWRRLFEHVLAVRKGLAPPPQQHDFDYWDAMATVDGLNMPTQGGVTFFERLSHAGMSASEIASLSRALTTSELLTEIEQQAFKLIEKRDTASRQQALSMLYSDQYFLEKANIMATIETAYKNGLQRMETSQAKASTLVTFMSRLMIFSVSLLVFLLLVSFWLLWRFYFSPIDKMQHQVVSNVANQDYDFSLSEQIKGELGQFSSAINSLLFNLRVELKLGRTIQHYNDLIRGKHQIHDVVSETKSFISRQFGFPLITFYHYHHDQLDVLDSVGQWYDPNPNDNSLLKICLETREHKSIASSDDNLLSLAMGDMRIALSELHFFPIYANNCPLGVLQLGCTEPISDNDLRLLHDLVEAFAIGFQLSLNAEKQQEIEQEVTRQLKLNQHIIDSIPNPTYYRNRLGEYLGVNEQFCHFMGVSEQAVLGANIEEVFEDDVVYQLKRYELELLQGAKRLQFELTLTNGQNEPRELVVYEAPFYDQNNSIMGVVGTFLDVTENKQLERELIKAKDSADNSSQIKGDFLANMSHEIRTPMNAIMGMTHLVLDTQLNDQQRNYVQKIDSASNQLLGIINDILDFSKVEAGKLTIEATSFKLNQVLDNLANVLSAKAENKAIELIFNVSPTIPNGLIGDPLRLGQVLINLVSNAIKFTDRGEVIVNVIEQSRNEASIKLKFTVEDTGIGMTCEQVNSLFQAFAQADTSTTRKYGGTGLGLSISKQLVELMGGEITATSHYGTGSEFTFELNLPYQANHESQQSLLPLSEVKYALVIDDNEAARLILASMLSDLMFEVDVAASARDGFKLLRDSSKHYDILLIDWQMPGMDGIETAEYIQRNNLANGAKIVLITAHANQLQLGEQYDKLFNSVLLKPITPSGLLNTVISSLGNSHYHPSPPETKNMTDELALLDELQLLLVEDNETNQEIACSILQKQGATIVIASHGLEALEKLKKHSFDLVLMDMQMPVMDGIAATKEIRKTHSAQQLPILAMTANAMQVDIDRCIKAGMNDHISKPIDVAQLVNKVHMYANPTHRPPQQSPIKALVPAETATALPFELEGVDIAQGIKVLMGDEENYRQTLLSFFQTLPIELGKIASNLNEQDLATAARRLHSLKGSSGTLAIDRVYQTVRKWESEVKAGETIDNEELLQLSGYCEQSYQRLLNINDAQPATMESAGKQPIDGQFHQLLDQLSIALLDADTQSLTLIEQLKQYQVSDPEPLNQMGVLLNNFQFDQAADLLVKVKRSL